MRDVDRRSAPGASRSYSVRPVARSLSSDLLKQELPLLCRDLQRFVERSKQLSCSRGSVHMPVALKLGHAPFLRGDLLLRLSDVALDLFEERLLHRHLGIVAEAGHPTKIIAQRASGSRWRRSLSAASGNSRCSFNALHKLRSAFWSHPRNLLPSAPVTPSIWLSARTLLHGFGDDASFQAALHADECLARGDMDG